MTYKPKSSLCVLCVLRALSVVNHKPNHSPQRQGAHRGATEISDGDYAEAS